MSNSNLLRKMSAGIGLLPAQLEKIIWTAPLRYKKFFIPKRDGSLRAIAQPAREVKAIQRWLVDELTEMVPVHEAVTAYRKGSSIKLNASLHAANNYLLKMDLKNFFPSILAADIRAHLTRYCEERYSAFDIDLMVRACTWTPDRSPKLRLCIGAPSSPLLSNSIMYDFDAEISSICSRNTVTYSRYADDMTFSCNRANVLAAFPGIVREILEKIPSPKLAINESKTVHTSRASLRQVTGIVITPSGDLSVGRDKKKLVRAMYHREKKGMLDKAQKQQLAGLLSFIEDIEPGFISRLKRLDEENKTKGSTGD